MKTYFDRNIFDHLKRLRSASESTETLAVLQNAVTEQRMRVLLSSTVLEETLPALNHSAQTLKEELEVIFSLVEKRRMIKPPAQLLKEAVQSYAYDRRLPDMLTRTPRFLEHFIARGRASQKLTEFAEEIVAQGSKFTDEFRDAYFNARKAGQERNIGRPDDFSEFCNGMTPAILEGLCQQHGVSARCVARGFEGLLKVKTVRLYLTYYAAWAYAKWFGEQDVPGKVKASERGDFFHSVQAAAADVFVTNDKRLARWLQQIPLDGFEILSLEQLIQRLSDNVA